jgi:hypothetical protein
MAFSQDDNPSQAMQWQDTAGDEKILFVSGWVGTDAIRSCQLIQKLFFAEPAQCPFRLGGMG